MTWHLERAVARLEKQLDEAEDPSDRAALMEELRELERELADAQRWADEGRERGWL